MNKLQALTALRDKVEAGKWSFNGWAEYPISRKDMSKFDDAYNGSLDAAKALHEAVLPGWTWVMGPAATHLWRDEDYGDPFCAPYEGVADNPARAWLLAILEALIEQEGNKSDQE